MEPYVLDVNRLVNDIKGYIAQLKSKYFENKDPIDDNEIVLQKLCVKLEIALRHGMKDKYSFLGMRKDYWNFFAECVPKDEGVRYANSLSQLNTVQGKGRALIRYCLVQKTFADTIQRTLMHRKKTEWYTPEALLLNKSISAALIGKLYDLNELEFHLSCTGCDLDMSWPSYGRTATDGYEKRTRRNSAGSIASTTDFTNERIDPLIALNAEILALKQMISRELSHEKGSTDDGIGESSMSSNEDAQPNIGDITLDISRLHQFILKWKSVNDAKLYKAEHEIQRIIQENNRLSQDSNAQREQLAEKHQNLSDLASKEATIQITDLQNKLRNAEASVIESERKFIELTEELGTLSENYKDSEKTLRNLKQDLSDSREMKKKLEHELCSLKENNETCRSEFQRLTDENNRIKSEIQLSQQNEILLRTKLEEITSKLNIKTLEKDKIQEAFENVNGLVFNSFEDFESYYKSQLLDKEKGLKVKDRENKILQERLTQLTSENEKLKEDLQESASRTQQHQQFENGETQQTQETHENDVSAFQQEAQILFNAIETANMNLSKLLDGPTDRLVEGENQQSRSKSTEYQCQTLVNNLNELDNNLRIKKEALTKAMQEKELLESQCKSLSLETNSLLEQNEKMQKEKDESLLYIQGQQEGKTELENQVRMLTDDKTKLENTLNCVRKEKSDVEFEIQNLNKQIQEDSYLRLVLENEVSELTQQVNEKDCEHANSLKEIERLKVEVDETEIKCKNSEVEFVKCKEELDLVTSNLDAKEKQLVKVEETLKNSQNEEEEMKMKIMSYEEQLTNLKSTMEQQVSSLKFQLSSEVLKYDEKIKTLSEEKQEAMVLRDKIQEQEETISELENKLKERNETWQTEKKKLTSDIKLLKNEIKALNGHIDENKQEIKSIENTLMLSKKNCEKEINRNQEYRKTIKEMKNQKSQNEKILEQEKSELEEDIKQLKNKLISLLSDKSELWKKSTQLEFEMKTRLSETWVEDKDVTHCPQCNVEFTLFLRKHHCRFCGNVFCHSCSDHLVKTIHSRKPYRACTSCYRKEQELKTDTSQLTDTSLDPNDSNVSIDSYGSDTEESLTSTPNNVVKNEAKQKNRSRSEELSDDEVESKHSSEFSDDSDENFQIIYDNEVHEDSLSRSLKNDSLSVKHGTEIKLAFDGSHDWSVTTIPAGKRYLMNVEVLSGTQIAFEFTTSEQDILFGVAIEETNSSKLKTLVSLCQIHSHERCAKKQLRLTSSGILMLVFDNTHPKSSSQLLRFKIYLTTMTDEPKTRRGTK